MPKYFNPDVMDFGLDRIRAKAAANNVDLLLVTEYAQGDSYATVDGNKICTIDLADTDLTLGDHATGRQLTQAAVSGTASGSSTQYDTGTATAGAATTLTDSGKAWTTDEHAGRAVKITAGTAPVRWGA